MEFVKSVNRVTGAPPARKTVIKIVTHPVIGILADALDVMLAILVIIVPVYAPYTV